MRIAALSGLFLGLSLCGAAARSDDKTAEPSKTEALTAEIDKLKLEIDTLRVENATLREKLENLEKSTTTKPSADLPATSFELGEPATLGAYKYKAPKGWIYQAVKGSTLGAVYRSPDKQAVIYVQLRPKGAVSVDQVRYGQSIIQKLKEDFLRSKTEVISPPAIVNDSRFYLKVHERIKVKSEKLADQSHIYLMPGKDLIELSVITTAEGTDQIASTQKLAEDVLLSFAPGK